MSTLTLDAFLAAVCRSGFDPPGGGADHPRDRRGGPADLEHRAGRRIGRVRHGPDRHQQRRRPADRARRRGGPHLLRRRATRAGRRLRLGGARPGAGSRSGAPLALAIDPLDGSSNVEPQSVLRHDLLDPAELPAAATGRWRASCGPAASQLAAGFLIYGPRLSLVLSVGEGTHIFDYSDRIGGYRLVAENVRVPPQAKEFAINASNYRHWDDSVRLYFDDCVRGRARAARARLQHALARLAGRRGLPHPGARRRVPLSGATSAPGYGNGRLRLVYEANPVAFLIEQAGGSATNGVEPILVADARGPAPAHAADLRVAGARSPSSPATTPIRAAIGERSPLFGQRGLFRA